MPFAPRRTCPRCGRIVTGGLCASCQRRANAMKVYDSEWATYSRAFLQRYPMCGDRPREAADTAHSRCRTNGLTVRAAVTDHIVPHGGDVHLLWSPTNHQALCASCHSTKTATEDGGFGRLPDESKSSRTR